MSGAQLVMTNKQFSHVIRPDQHQLFIFWHFIRFSIIADDRKLSEKNIYLRENSKAAKQSQKGLMP